MLCPKGIEGPKFRRFILHHSSQEIAGRLDRWRGLLELWAKKRQVPVVEWIIEEISRELSIRRPRIERHRTTIRWDSWKFTLYGVPWEKERWVMEFLNEHYIMTEVSCLGRMIR